MENTSSPLPENHQDFQLLSLLNGEISQRVGETKNLEAKFSALVRDALDFVLDPVRTARTTVAELDNVEKTFIGLKLEHFVRDMLDVPKGLRDLRIGDFDVDIKNTVRKNWSIPEETYRASELCLLMSVNDVKVTCSLGLFVAREEYLGRCNRDKKKGILKHSLPNIWWLARDIPFPESRFIHVDMGRFRQLRKTLSGSQRAAQFWRENLRLVVHRDVMKALLFDQDDFMKRLRANKGAPDILSPEGIAILIGKYTQERDLAAAVGVKNLRADEIVAVSPTTFDDWKLLTDAGVISSPYCS